KYDKLLKDIELEREKLVSEYEAKKHSINQPVEEYKKFLFEAKNAHNLAKENAHYDFNISKEKVYSQTINEEQREYESIKKSLLKSFKIKLSSLDDSVGLSKDIREQQKVALTQMYEKD